MEGVAVFMFYWSKYILVWLQQQHYARWKPLELGKHAIKSLKNFTGTAGTSLLNLLNLFRQDLTWMQKFSQSCSEFTVRWRFSDFTLSSTIMWETTISGLDMSKLDRKWCQHVFESEVKPEMTWSDYCKLIWDAKTLTRECKYPNLIRFVATPASCLFCNAVVENTFNSLQQINTDRRSSL